jgi:DNA-binding transcriptional MocR family regulator
MRLGWVAGPPDVVEKYQLLQEQTSQFPSGFSQSIFSGLVNHWSGANYSGSGFDFHVREVNKYLTHILIASKTIAVKNN